MATEIDDQWSFGLIKDMQDPKKILEQDDHVVVIKDKYPKAEFHYLVLPRKNIASVSKLTKEDLELLKHVYSVAKKLADSHKMHEFKIGYHAVPNMKRLHAHVISTDFNSSHLKSKHHWNAFTTPFFLPLEDVCHELEVNGQIKINVLEYKNHLLKCLKCHKCSYAPKNMPDLKKHILKHFKKDD